MNPPYSNVEPWIRKFIAHGNGVALVNFGNSKWLRDLWNSDVSMVALRHDLRFIREGMRTDIRWVTVLCAFGDECVEAIARVGRVR